MPSLVHLNLTRARFSSALFTALAKHCRRLRTLNLSWSRGYSSIDELVQLGDMLLTLDICGMHEVPDANLARVISGLPHLKHLRMSDVFSAGQKSLLAIEKSRVVRNLGYFCV